MAYLVGNKIFSNLQDALRYSEENAMFGGGGSVSYFDESILNDPAQSQDIFRGPVLNSGTVFGSEFEIPPEDVIGPTETLEDSIFQILMETIIGEQGIPEGVSAEAIAAIRGDFGPTTTPAELQEIAIDIAEAGGFDEWLAQQDLEGPPEELPTELEEEIDIGSDTTDTDVEVDPDMPIYIPFPDLPPREEGDEGEGENGEGTGAEGEGTDTGRGQDRGDAEEPPRGGGRGGGSIADDPVGRSEEDPFRVIFGPTVSGSSGEGVGGGGVQPTSMLTPRFSPYMASIGYTPVAIPKPILPQAPIVSSLFSEFLS